MSYLLFLDKYIWSPLNKIINVYILTGAVDRL